jgi:hypothetical protein
MVCEKKTTNAGGKTMKNQYFGIEIELTGLTRKNAAEVIAKHFNTTAIYKGGTYGIYTIQDGEGRQWQAMNDGSIRPERQTNNGLVAADFEYKVEVVSPKCEYKDIETIQELVRKLRAAGAIANETCGIHIHIDGSNHDTKTLRNIANIIASKEDLIYKALEVDTNRQNRFCKKVEQNFINTINKEKPSNLSELNKIWYAPYGSESSSMHYHSSRYHGLNLHSIFQKGTIEFRLFNGTTHAGKIKAYIQFCLAISNQALIQRSASPRKTQTTNEKYTFRTWLLRLGLIGEEFKTARHHLLANLQGNIAWRNVA